MKLKDLAAIELMKTRPFKEYHVEGSVSNSREFYYTYSNGEIKVGYYQKTNEARFSLITDGQEVPFAIVKKIKGADTYKASVEILPSMIPQALEGLALYMQTHPTIIKNKFSKRDAEPYIAEIQSVQHELNKILVSTILERKVEQSYRKVS